MVSPYSPDNLPPFVAGSPGLIAKPRPKVTYVCVLAPTAVRLTTAWINPDDLAANGAPIVLQYNFNKGDLHMLFTPNGRSGPAPDVVWGENGTYSIEDPSMQSHHDVRIALMRGFWAQAGIVPHIMLVRRTARIEVVGQLTNNSRAAGQLFEQPGLPPLTLEAACYIVKGASGQMYVLAERDMRRMFSALITPSGQHVRNIPK